MTTKSRIVRGADSVRNSRERGSALVMAIFLTIFTAGIVISGSAIIRSSQTRTATQFLIHGQASNFARSGLVEAVNWLRRQPTQPVVSFAPQLDTNVNPPLLETDDPDIGLVREFRITGDLFGRYEVWKAWPTDPDPGRLAWRQRMQARDVSLLREMSSPGNAWHLTCISYVYQRRDAAKAFDVRPNHILASESLTMEVTRLSFALPGQAALCAGTGAGVTVGASTEIDGGSSAAGIYYPQGSGLPTVTGLVTGNPSTSPAVVYDASPKAVFGVLEQGLRTMADDHVTIPAALPSPVPQDSFLFVEAGPITFSPATPLHGSGILYVKGDVTITAGSSSLFSGLLYVDGNLSLAGPAEIHGAVIVTGSVSLLAGTGPAKILFSQAVLDSLRNAMSSYRTTRPIVRRNVRD